jgi:hypothetical protein
MNQPETIFEANAKELTALRVRVKMLEAVLLAILDDASPCTSGCSKMASDDVLDAAREALESK